MNLDQYGLPVQANGDANDQLQRVGMILVADCIEVNAPDSLYEACVNGLDHNLQPKPGLYTRSTGSPTSSVSADQLISALGAQVAHGDCGKPEALMFLRMLARFGFAQNYRDTLGGTNALQLPDFMLLRAMPLFVRAHWLFYPLSLIVDLYLLVMAISAVFYARSSPDNVDQNDTALTLAVCSKRFKTPWVSLSNWIIRKYLPANSGSSTVDSNHMYDALKWYHRAEAGGNPEVAELWKPICEELW